MTGYFPATSLPISRFCRDLCSISLTNRPTPSVWPVNSPRRTRQREQNNSYAFLCGSSRAPAADCPIDDILHLCDYDSEHREHDQHRKNLLGLQHLAGEIEARAEADFSYDHLRGNDQNDGYAETEPDA